MANFKYSFFGRGRGAIGINHSISGVLNSGSETDAENSIRKDFEILHSLSIEQLQSSFPELQRLLFKSISDCSGTFGEYALPDGDFLLAEISACEGGFIISADFDKPCYFSGEVIKLETGFKILFNEYEDNFISYLSLASAEINEGYLFPNGLIID